MAVEMKEGYMLKKRHASGNMETVRVTRVLKNTFECDDGLVYSSATLAAKGKEHRWWICERLING